VGILRTSKLIVSGGPEQEAAMCPPETCIRTWFRRTFSGELATRAGVSVKAARYYEQPGFTKLSMHALDTFCGRAQHTHTKISRAG